MPAPEQKSRDEDPGPPLTALCVRSRSTHYKQVPHCPFMANDKIDRWWRNGRAVAYSHPGLTFIITPQVRPSVSKFMPLLFFSRFVYATWHIVNSLVDRFACEPHNFAYPPPPAPAVIFQPAPIVIRQKVPPFPILNRLQLKSQVRRARERGSEVRRLFAPCNEQR
jgi:hypothetical protein